MEFHDEKLHNLHSSQNIIWMRWAGYVARMREMRNAYKMLVGKEINKERKRPYGKPRRKWVDKY
jgi:hypothetical protein